jgi:DNA-binding transcriptional ArsR family regulator
MAAETNPTIEAQQDAIKLTRELLKLEDDERTALERFDAERAQARTRIAELRQAIADKHREVASALNIGAAPAPAVAERNGRGRRRRTGGSGVTVDDAAIVEFVRTAGEPVAALDIAKALKLTDASGKVPPTVSNHLKALHESGALTRTGAKKGTRYAAAA